MQKMIKTSAVLLGMVFLAGCGQMQDSQKQPVVPSPVGKQQLQSDVNKSSENNQKISETVYMNSQFEFQITLPKGWENYKALTNEKTGNKNVLVYVYVDLPTSEKTWPGDIDTATGKSLMGYASMFAVTVWSMDGYNAELKSCKIDPSSSCPNSDTFSARGYVFAISGPQAMPEDLQKSIGSGYIETIKQSFELTELSSNKTASSQLYKNEKYGFEFQYPNKFMVVSTPSNNGDDFVVVSDSYVTAMWQYNVSFENNSDKLTLEKAVAKSRGNGNVVDTIIDGKLAKRYSIKNYGDYGNAGIVLIVGDNIVSISGDDSTDLMKKDFEKFISTIKFTK